MTVEHTLIAEIDQAEMILRMIEAASGMPRPAGFSARECLAQIQSQNADTCPTFKRAAVAAMKYVEECIEKGQVPS